MPLPVFHEVTREREVGGGAFPLELRRQARARPTGEGVRFVATQMTHRRLRIQLAQTAIQGELLRE